MTVPAGGPEVSLDDKYTAQHGRVFMSGRQALVRLPLLQRDQDRRRGLNTAGFITGYRGSPLGGYDSELWRARKLLQQNDILFQPGLNEDIAATAVWGTQQIGFLPERNVDGVFAIWYGKGPGVDRSGDPLKHANLQGVLLAFGDDHAGKSSTTAHQSDLALAANDIPVLYPSSVAEILRYGLAGLALSRYAGLLVGLKLVNETAEATSIVDLDTIGSPLLEPVLELPPGGVHIRKEFLAVQAQDLRLVRHKLPRAHAFIRANRLDRIAFGAPQPRFLIVTAGKSYADTIAALELLGIDQARAVAIGLAVYKVAMIWPLEPEGLREAAAWAEELLFVEEKRPQMERQAAQVLFHSERRLRLSGKHDPDGEMLLPADVPFDAGTVAVAIAARLRASLPELAGLLPDLAALSRTVPAMAGAIGRRPSFCAGCPHSISTKVPDGSHGATGIGCHGMAVLFPDRKPLPMTHMGGEGAMWLGLAPFTGVRHIFQNLGDGTYNHSGSMAIRAAVQAGVNITYKILFNDAVAMTGGQPVEGALTVGRIAAQVLAEGVGRVVVVAEQPERFHSTGELPAGVRVFPRAELDAVQRTLRDESGVTVLIYDQVCAAEKRRRRKRGLMPDASRRVFINHLACEGCGDCSVQSNCLAIQPRETELGRKRAIDQSACNKDTSCLDGFCPSFVTIEGATPVRAAPVAATALLADLPEPAVPVLSGRSNIVFAGVGGTGIVTVSAVLGMAAHLQSHGVSLYDMTGLSQKGGAVFSHVRLFADAAGVAPACVGAGEADLLLACDPVAAIQAEAIRTVDPGRTAVIANDDIAATSEFHTQPDLALDADRFAAHLQQASGGRAPHRLPASLLAMRHLGDAIGANMILLGFAWQLGRIPLPRAAIEQAIALNAVSVSFNLDAFRLGRAAAVHGYAALLADGHADVAESLDQFIAGRTDELRRYQNAAYAQRYAELVAGARRHDDALAADAQRFTWAVARGAFHLMAYKDEYEVARLYTDGRFAADMRAAFKAGGKIRVHLAPPMLSRRDPNTGRPRKRAFGAWVFPLFRGLAVARFLRGTALDPFGYTGERQMERRIRDAYLAEMSRLVPMLSADIYEDAVAAAALPLRIRGYGPVKLQNVAAHWDGWEQQVAALTRTG